jgi:hypothetical protein
MNSAWVQTEIRKARQAELRDKRFQNRSHVRQNVGKPVKIPRSGERGYDAIGF